MPKYRSFNQLAAHEAEDVDYRIRYRFGSSGMAVVAIHGGGIEPGTTEIADAVAGRRHSFYTFSGIKNSGNASLHITSHLFDEPRGKDVVSGASIVLSIHGCWESEPIVFIGGRHRKFAEELGNALGNASFRIGKSVRYPGLNPFNICNRGRSTMGVQLEISAGLRHIFFGNLQCVPLQVASPLLHRFNQTIVTVLENTDNGIGHGTFRLF